MPDDDLATPRPVGVVGLGAMGRGIAALLRRRGYAVHVHDVRAEAATAFAAEGGTACASPAALAEACDTVVSVVVDAAQTEAVLFGAAAGGRSLAASLAPGGLFVMCSTVDPNVSAGFARRLEAMGRLYLDAPISGGAARAASGEMTMMTGGSEAAYAKAGGLLDAMAGKVYRLGAAGQGSRVKIINQLLAGVHIAAAAEAMALGLREGVAADALYDVITHSAGNSWMFENRMAHVVAGDYTPLSAVDIFVKDLGLVLDTARATKFPLPLASTAHQMFMQASSAGFGREDDAAVIKIFPGIDLPPKAPLTMATLRLGCIADDFTGATDLANNLVRAGLRTVQTIGVPAEGEAPPEADAVVVALKSRTIPAPEAVRQSLAACRWLRAAGAEQIYFKVCSTFDSTPAGNIGPVMEALMDALGCDFAVATPAFPDNGRTVFKGHLFVGDVLLSESGMRHHPLTPMTDANLVRVLQAQLDPSRGRRVGLLDHRVVAAGGAVLAARLDALRAEGVAIAIADAVDNDDLLRLGAAAGALPLVCAGSGLAIGLATSGSSAAPERSARLPPAAGRAAVVSGSCSSATLAQVAAFVGQGGTARAIDPMAPGDAAATATDVAAWARAAWAAHPDAPVLVYSSAEPAAVRAVQTRLGADAAGARTERMLAAVAAALVGAGARRLVVAGGETSGACVQALGIGRLQIGPQIDPGVPWCHAESAHGALHLALKSGNFGGADFFTRAFRVLDAAP